VTTALQGGEVSVQVPSRALFVLSVWRSGSSLLYALLNQHSQIALLYEGDLPHLRSFLWGRFRNGDWRQRWEFWNQGPSRHGIAVESLPARVSDVWEATRLVYKSVARRKQAAIWGEKTPHWYDCPLQLARKFQDAHFIFLWRDINAVMESISRAAVTERFFRKPGFAEKVIIGTEKLREACDSLQAEGCAVHEVNYEDLTSNTTQAMSGICEFLQIPFEPQITSLEGADRSAVSSGRHHTAVRGNVIAAEKRAMVLSPQMKDKIARYICRWKLRTGDAWPKYPVVLPKGAQPPGALELCQDRAAYHSFVARDRAVKMIYAAVPLAFAQTLRAWVRAA
jgi:hypothetical protein